MGPRVRKAVAFFHRWVGLVLGFYLVVLGLTGSFLVFRRDIEERVAPELVRVPAPPGACPLEASDLVAAIRRTFTNADEATLSSLTWPRYTGGAYALAVDDKTVLVDPYRGEVIRQFETESNPIEIVGNLHMVLLWRAKGMLLNTYGGIVSCALLVSGLWLWWPKTVSQIRSRLSVKRGSSLKRTMNDLHNVLGVASLIFLIMACATGAVFGVWEAAQATVYRMLGGQKPAEAPSTVPVPQGRKRLSFDVLVAKVESAMPGARLQGLTYPAKPDAPLTAYGAVDEGRSVYVTIALNPYSGELLQREDSREAPAAGNVMRWVHFLHLGQWGGWIVKVLYAVFGLAPLALYITGIGRWILRKSGKRPRPKPIE